MGPNVFVDIQTELNPPTSSTCVHFSQVSPPAPCGHHIWMPHNWKEMNILAALVAYIQKKENLTNTLLSPLNLFGYTISELSTNGCSVLSYIIICL